jgi:hypothetical protein
MASSRLGWAFGQKLLCGSLFVWHFMGVSSSFVSTVGANVGICCQGLANPE